jgi:opacity protein-like surface antigen
MRLKAGRKRPSSGWLPKVTLSGFLLLASGTQAVAEETSSDWQFYFTPYLWMTGLGMETRGIGPIPSNDMNVDFTQVWDHLNFALQANLEVRKDRFLAILDLNYFNLGADEGLSGPVFDHASLDMVGVLASANVGYTVVTPDPISFEPFVGVQVYSVDVDLSFRGGPSPSASDTKTFVDPMVGFQSRLMLGSDFFVDGLATIGGFGVSSKLTYQLFGGLGWQANEWLQVRAGYRHFFLEQSGGKLIRNVTMSGPIVGATFRF